MILHRKCEFIKLWEKKRDLNKAVRKMWDLIRKLHDAGQGGCKHAMEAREAIRLANERIRQIDTELNMI